MLFFKLNSIASDTLTNISWISYIYGTYRALQTKLNKFRFRFPEMFFNICISGRKLSTIFFFAVNEW